MVLKGISLIQKHILEIDKKAHRRSHWLPISLTLLAFIFIYVICREIQQPGWSSINQGLSHNIAPNQLQPSSNVGAADHDTVKRGEKKKVKQPRQAFKAICSTAGEARIEPEATSQLSRTDKKIAETCTDKDSSSTQILHRNQDTGRIHIESEATPKLSCIEKTVRPAT